MDKFKNSEMKQVFDNFNNAERINLADIDKIKSSKSKSELLSAQKVQAFKQIFKLAEKNIKRKAFDIFDKFNVEFQITVEDLQNYSESFSNAVSFKNIDTPEKQGLKVSMNFNLAKILQLPAEEVYAFVYATMYNSLLKKRASVSEKDEIKFGKVSELEEDAAVNDANNDRQGNYIQPKKTIIDYIKDILRLLFGDDKSNYDACAKQIKKDFTENGIGEQDLFENPNGKNLLAERYGKLVKKGYEQQATFLLGEISKNDFKRLANGNDSEIKSFCVNLSKSILRFNNINENEVNIEFTNEGNFLGSYSDRGFGGQSLIINLEKIKQKNNPAELVMVLTHELTHAIDSTINKSIGNVTDKGYGLQDNLVGGTNGIESVRDLMEKRKIESDRDINNTEKRRKYEIAKDIFDYTKKLQEICYRVNPNERSARMGELSAVIFLQKLSDDPEIKSYADASINSYKNYQNKVIENINEVDAMISKFHSAIENNKEVDTETKRIIAERIAYLESLKQRDKLKSSIAFGDEGKSLGIASSGLDKENELGDE